MTKKRARHVTAGNGKNRRPKEEKMKDDEKTLSLRQKNYSPAYRNVIDEAVKLASRTESGLLTPGLLFRALLRTRGKDVARLLGRECSFPENDDLRENGPCLADKVFFSAETDRYLSLYGGVLGEIVKIFGHDVKLDAIHIAAALLWDPKDEIREFLNFNGFDSGSAAFRKQIGSVLTALDAKTQKQKIRQQSAAIKAKLRNIRGKLERACFGQSAAIRTVITQLDLFWSQTTYERRNKALSFCFVGASGTGKSLLANALRTALSEELDIPETPELDMSRFAAEQLALDMIGRDSSWRDGGREGELTKRAAYNPNGVILIENFDKAHPDALAHVDTMLTTGLLKDNFTGETVSFAGNIVILTTNSGAAFCESEKFMALCGNGTGGIPRDKLIDGLCSTVEQLNPLCGGLMRMILAKTDAPVLFRNHDADTIPLIVKQAAHTVFDRLKATFKLRVECDLERLAFFFMEAMPRLDSAHGVVPAVEATLYIPIQEACIDANLTLGTGKKFRIELEELPELGAAFGDHEPYSAEWIRARTQKRLLMAKRLDYKTQVSFDRRKNITLRLGQLSYQVMPSIEDAGFFSVQPPNMSFRDLVGLDIPWEKVQRTLAYFRNPEKGTKPETGILLYGPPGTGKTSFAKAVAAELGVPFISVSGADFCAGDVQVGVLRVKSLFAVARKYQAIIFIDEIDAVGSRENLCGPFASVINTLLSELDGYEERRVLVIGATNRKSSLDKALLRPGRLHAMIEVGLLRDPGDRRKLVEMVCRAAETTLDPALTEFIVKTTDYWSPAVLKATVRDAIHMADEKKHDVTREDFIAARNIGCYGEFTQTLRLNDKARRQVSIHEAGHAVAAWLHGFHWVQVSINSTGGDNLGFLECMPSKPEGYTEEELKANIDVGLAGRAAEELLSCATEGCSSDFKQASSYAVRIIRAGFGQDAEYAIQPDEDEELNWSALAPKVNRILCERMDAVKELLSKNLGLLNGVVEELCKRGVMFEDDMPRVQQLVENCARFERDER